MLQEVLVRGRAVVPFCDPHTTLTSKTEMEEEVGGGGKQGEEGGEGSKEKIEMALRFSVSLSFFIRRLSPLLASKRPGILGVFRVRPLIVV